MDEVEQKLYNMSQEEMEAIANGEDKEEDDNSKDTTVRPGDKS